jgi:hypothetical protein
MNIKRLLAIMFIIGCTSVCWITLAGTVQFRSSGTQSRLTPEVSKNWGPVLKQEHPILYYEAPAEANTRREIQPERSEITVNLGYDPKNKGLLWYRTYTVDFDATYRVKNPTPITQTIYAAFRFPAEDARYDNFSLVFGNKSTN